MSRLSKYITAHEQPYTMSFKNGKGTIEVMFYDGYITIRSRQPGVHFNNEIHIKRKTWLKMLCPQLVKVTRMMTGPSFDRYRAERRWHRDERQHLEELRAQKRERQGPRRRRRTRTRVRRGQA